MNYWLIYTEIDFLPFFLYYYMIIVFQSFYKSQIKCSKIAIIQNFEFFRNQQLFYLTNINTIKLQNFKLPLNIKIIQITHFSLNFTKIHFFNFLYFFLSIQIFSLNFNISRNSININNIFLINHFSINALNMLIDLFPLKLPHF